MLITQKPEYDRKIEEDRLSPFSNDEVLLNLADKRLSNADTYTAQTYYNFAIVLNSHIERALACESPRLQPAVQRLCELSSLVGKASDIRVADDEQKSLSAFTKALLARRAADLILVHRATSSLNRKSYPEWRVCVSALSQLALYWLAACKHTTSATSALVALEALEANSIRKHLNVDEGLVEKLLKDHECVEKLVDACGAACPSATSSPSRSGHSLPSTYISFVPLIGFEKCIEEATDRDAPLPLSEEKYSKCIKALAGTLENPMVLRRLVNVMRVDSVMSSGSFIDTLFSSLPAYPNEISFKGTFNADLSRFDLKAYLVFLMGWTRVCLSSPLSPITGASRLLSPAPLPSSLFTQHQISLWNALVLRGQQRFNGRAEHALSVQGVKKVTRLTAAPSLPLMGTLFYTIREDATGDYVTELYARKIVETICCCDSFADRAIFRPPQGGIDFDSDDETRLLNDASVFISSRHMERGEWLDAEKTLLMCEETEMIVEQLVEVYSGWLRALDARGESRGGVERKLKEMKGAMEKLRPRSDKENEEGTSHTITFTKRGDNSNTRSPAISIEADDLNHSYGSSEYASAPSTPFKNGTIFGAETPTFHTPGGRPSLWPGAVQRNLFLQATQNASSTPKSSRSSIPTESREEEVQTDADDSVFMPDASVSTVPFHQTNNTISSAHRSASDEAIEFEFESLAKSLELINEGLVQRTQAKVDQFEKIHEEEREEEKRRKEEEDNERRKGDEEIRRLNEKMEKKRMIISTPKTPNQSSHGHRPLGATATVDALPLMSVSSALHRLPQQPLQSQSYLQQPWISAAASAATPSTVGPTLHQLLMGNGPASVHSPGIHRIGEIRQAAVWNAPILNEQKERGDLERKKEAIVPTTKALSAFETAFMKKKEEERGEKKKEEEGGQHKGCICCDTDEQQDRWFAAYDRLTEKYDRSN